MNNFDPADVEVYKFAAIGLVCNRLKGYTTRRNTGEVLVSYHGETLALELGRIFRLRRKDEIHEFDLIIEDIIENGDIIEASNGMLGVPGI
jgi:hypothetical protein